MHTGSFDLHMFYVSDLVPRRDDAMDYTLTVTDLQEQVDIELSKLLDGLDALPEG